jgi:hypothetical protein
VEDVVGWEVAVVVGIVWQVALVVGIVAQPVAQVV